ncbi:MAG: class A beta-lactamase, subclass A2 [Arcicella sp.]|nr:class A beta-lactamase, subclass A2 [Arcicella sp.]
MKKITFLLSFHFLSFFTFAQLSTLKNKIQNITKDKKAIVGISILNLNGGDTLTFNNQHHFPMQSVFKFHLALTILDLVDKGKFTLNQPIFVKKSDMLSDLYSPMRDKYPAGNIRLPLSEIIKYTVSQSDNSGCDLLFKLIGGTEVANQYIHNLGINDLAIKNPEVEIQADWSIQYENWTTPTAATKLLESFYKKNILSKNSYDFLWKTMVETSTGLNKIKGKLPKEAIVAHKTGYSGANKEGMVAATNDIGMVVLPNGKKFAIALFVSDSMENEKTNDGIMADITKVVWDYYTGQ